jgi:hypothetical protein
MMLTTACPAALHYNLLRTCFLIQTASVRALTVELPVRRRTRGRRAVAVAVEGSSPALFPGLSIPTPAIFLVLITKTATAAEGGGKVNRAKSRLGGNNGLRLHAKVTTVVFIPMLADHHRHHQPVHSPLHRSHYHAGVPRVLRTPMMTPPTHFLPAVAATMATAPASAAAAAAGAAAFAA